MDYKKANKWEDKMFSNITSLNLVKEICKLHPIWILFGNVIKVKLKVTYKDDMFENVHVFLKKRIMTMYVPPTNIILYSKTTKVKSLVSERTNRLIEYKGNFKNHIFL